MQKKTVFIIGLYKCGTSWLSLALGKHPQAMALPEFDVIRAFAQEQTGSLQPKSIEERVQYVFTASNYGRLPPDVTRALPDLSAEGLFGHIEANVSKRIFLKGAFVSDMLDPARKKQKMYVGKGCELSTFMTYWNLDKDSARKVFTDCITHEDPIGAMHHFCDIHRRFSGDYLVLKSADQINHIHHLQRLMPDAPKVLILRDGRDMAISAAKFEQYVRAQTHFGDVWKLAEQGFWERLQQWVWVTQRIDELRAKGEVFVLRYEDLTSDFEATFAKVLGYLGMDASLELVKRIKKETSFERMSGGRKRGVEDVRSNIRRGMVGEWKELLGPKERDRAWKIAGEVLERFGYEAA